MSILEFVKAFHIGGTETQVVELLRGLPKHYEIDVAVLKEEGLLMEEVWKAGFLPHEFPLGSSFVSPQSALAIARLAFFLRNQRIQLVHAHDFYSTLVAVPACKAARVPVIVSRLDLLHWHGPRRSKALAEWTRQADVVVVNAEAIVRHLIEKEHILPHKIVLIRNGVDLQRLDELRARGIQKPLPDIGHEPFVVHVANMGHEVKRQEDLLQALSLLRSRFGPVHAFFVGDGDRRQELESHARSLGLHNYAHFLGFRHDAPAIMANASMGILCSRNEGLSNAIIEGMASRLPMVVTNVGGNPELVEDGKRGRVVPPCDPEALSEAMDEILRDRNLAQKMGAAGREFVEQHLTVQQMIGAHDALYQNQLRQRSGRQLGFSAIFG